MTKRAESWMRNSEAVVTIAVIAVVVAGVARLLGLTD
jgi:hypothetical protein